MKKKRYFRGLKCCMCGRFTSYHWAEESAPFGNANDLEPPDSEFFCPSCAKEQEDYYVKAGWVPSPWHKAPWMDRAAKRLGLVEAGPSGAAWSKYFHPDKLPDGYEVVKIDARWES